MTGPPPAAAAAGAECATGAVGDTTDAMIAATPATTATVTIRYGQRTCHLRQPHFQLMAPPQGTPRISTR